MAKVQRTAGGFEVYLEPDERALMLDNAYFHHGMHTFAFSVVPTFLAGLKAEALGKAKALKEAQDAVTQAPLQRPTYEMPR